jgi:hypothetical protein
LRAYCGQLTQTPNSARIETFLFQYSNPARLQFFVRMLGEFTADNRVSNPHALQSCPLALWGSFILRGAIQIALVNGLASK